MDYKKFAELSPCDYAGPLQRESFMDAGIKELWPDIPRIAGPAFTVEMVAGDNLALHRAIYEAPKGSVIVAQTNSMDYACIWWKCMCNSTKAWNCWVYYRWCYKRYR